MPLVERKICGDVDHTDVMNVGNLSMLGSCNETHQILDMRGSVTRGLGLACLLFALSIAPTQRALAASAATVRVAYGGTVIESSINSLTNNSDTMAGDQRVTKSDFAVTSISDFATVGLASMSMSGFASSKAGTLKASLAGSLNVTSANTGTFRVSTGFLSVAFAEAGWLDVAVVEGLTPGRKITFNGVMMLDGGQEAAVQRGNPSGDTVLGGTQVTLTGTGITSVSGLAREQIGPNAHVRLPAPNRIPVHTTMVVGELQPIGYTLRVSGNITASASAVALPGLNTASFTGDFSHTLAWGGITGITDFETGEILSGWKIKSDSGFDYSLPAPVPLPATFPLLLASMAALTRVRRGKISS